MLAPAKINLDLAIVGRRPDGYHELDSTVVFAALGDQLTLAEGAPGLAIDGPFAQDVKPTRDNLVLRAADAIANRAGRVIDCGFRLTKNLPVGAGIGGGSSDAATAILLLAERWRLDLGELSEVGLSLGADIPVCLSRRAARMRGIGEKVEPLNQAHRAQLAGRPVLLVNPLEPLETKAVFAAYAAMGGQSSVSKEGQGPRPNDLLGPALDHCPTIGQILSALEGAISVRDFGMSGSGPTCFALFDRIADCQTTARDIACAYPEWWVRSSHLI